MTSNYNLASIQALGAVPVPGEAETAHPATFAEEDSEAETTNTATFAEGEAVSFSDDVPAQFNRLPTPCPDRIILNRANLFANKLHRLTGCRYRVTLRLEFGI
jgi:hypothetical protein